MGSRKDCISGYPLPASNALNQNQVVHLRASILRGELARIVTSVPLGRSRLSRPWIRTDPAPAPAPTAAPIAAPLPPPATAPIIAPSAAPIPPRVIVRVDWLSSSLIVPSFSIRTSLFPSGVRILSTSPLKSYLLPSRRRI